MSSELPHPSNQMQMMPSMYPPGYPPWMFMQPPVSGPAASGAPPWPPQPFPPTSYWGPNTTQAMSPPPVAQDPATDHYTVDSLRRIYSNEDASIEIERVKVQRRQPNIQFPAGPPGPPAIAFPGFPPNFPPPPVSDSRSLVPFIGPQPPPQRRPPPRKHRKNRLNNQLVPAQPQASAPYPLPYYPAPYFSYVPYPYPYPCFSYPWSPATTESPPAKSSTDMKNDNNERLRQRSLPASPDSQRLESGTPCSIRDSISPEACRPLSSNAPSQISLNTESQGTDLAPSDSVSVGGYRNDSSRNAHNTSKDTAWMVEMQKHLASIDDLSETGDRSSFTTAQTDVPSPPSRRNKPKIAPIATKTYEDNEDDKCSTVSDNSSKSLKNAFRDLENSASAFKTQVETKTTKRPAPVLPTTVISTNSEDVDRRSSVASFHSARNVSDVVVAETDSTEILIATDTATADEVHYFLCTAIICISSTLIYPTNIIIYPYMH